LAEITALENYSPAQEKKMRVYKSKVGGIESVFDNVEDAVNELREILTNGLPGDYNEYSIYEMTKEEFDALPEFEGH
jgi:threonine synthase